MLIGNELGKPVKVYITTLRTERGRYARICIEIDLTKPLTSVITICGYYVKVEYEGLHLICFECSRYGHRSAECGKEANGAIPKEPAKQDSRQDGEVFGTWMVVTNNRGRRSQSKTSETRKPTQTIGGDGNQRNGPLNDGSRSQNLNFGVAARDKVAQEEVNYGSRFGPLTVEEYDCEEAKITEVSTVRKLIEQIPAMGSDVNFSSISKNKREPSKGRSKKGVLVKPPTKVKAPGKSPQMPRTEASCTVTHLQAHGPEEINRIHLKDLTNFNPIPHTPQIPWKPINTDTLNTSSQNISIQQYEQVKHHPPDGNTEDLNMVLVEGSDTSQGIGNMESILPPQQEDIQCIQTDGNGGNSTPLLI